MDVTVGPGARSDAHLIADGSEVGFAELCRRHAVEVYSFFRFRLAWAAADLTAETFAQAWISRRRFRDDCEGSALPWLLGIGRNVLRESVRRDRLETRARERLGLPLDLATEDGFEAVEEQLSPRRALADALENLPPHERRALELRVVDGLPYGEVADHLAIRPAAARLRVSRALRRLAQAISKEEQQ
jgi:RNA polymerase sigma factor (sigma-70 family)